MDRKTYVDLRENIVAFEKRFKAPNWGDMVATRVKRLCELNKLPLRNEKDLRRPGIEKLFQGKPYVYKYSDSMWWGFMKRYNESIFTADPVVYSICRTKTAMGGVWFSTIEEETEKGLKDRYQCYTTHFFERRMERLGLKDMDRTLRHFVKTKLTMMSVGMHEIASADDKFPGGIFLPMMDGTALGEKFNDILLLKTFVSMDMMSNQQVDLAADITKHAIFNSINEQMEKSCGKSLSPVKFEAILRQLKEDL